MKYIEPLTDFSLYGIAKNFFGIKIVMGKLYNDSCPIDILHTIRMWSILR
jgi:hypothetical protein